MKSCKKVANFGFIEAVYCYCYRLEKAFLGKKKKSETMKWYKNRADLGYA